MKISNATVISSQVQQDLRNDTTLGCGNFLDRSHALNPNRGIEFVFLERAFQFPDGREYQVFSIETLMQARQCLARWYTQLGVNPGDIVTLCVSDGIMPFIHYLAITSLGAAASIINPAMAPDMAKAYMQKHGFERLVVDQGVLDNTHIVEQLASDEIPLRCEVINYSEATEADLKPLPLWWPYTHQDTTLVMLSHTSGTTGVPKAVRFEHRQFFMGKRARIGLFTESGYERFLTALPSSHSAAISHLETVVMLGIPTYVMSNATSEPVRAAIKKFAPTLVAGFPQTYASIVQTGVELNEFVSVKRWFSMGDAAHGDHIRRILRGAPESCFIDSFGSSELGTVIFRKVSTYDDIAPSRCVGRPVEIAVAKVLDMDTGEELTNGETGYLAVRSPSITSGYWNSPDVTARAWCNGYFLTGDVGFCKEGDYYLIDRAVDVIESSAGTIYTLMLEEEAQRIESVCDVSVVGIPSANGGKDRVFALVLLDQGKEASADVLGNQVWQTLNKAASAHGRHLGEDDVTVAVANGPGCFPVGATGKVLKRRLREDYPDIVAALGHDDPIQERFLYLTNGMKTSPLSRVTAKVS